MLLHWIHTTTSELFQQCSRSTVVHGYNRSCTACALCNCAFLFVQRVADIGVKDQQWVVEAEGPHLRLDIPVLMPHVLKKVKKARKLGQLVTQ